ncbi:MAG: carboxypeptidase regulatory-like domain-containing protein [candidate division WOR-3 bacterium]|nr:MAG: carboxypeptidase regulatory-like domain-containing protein [candidate division WOR-3 bacterium]
MGRLSIAACIVLLVTLACLEPPRNNPYDPNNPDKGYLAGTAYDHNGDFLEGATVKLRIGDIDDYTTQTDFQGNYEFAEVDPGLYTVVGEAEYYNTLTFEDVEIKSYTHNDTFNLYFEELYFNFENEQSGTAEPFGFRQLFGTWQIQEDQGEPGQHSIPMVYGAVSDPMSTFYALSVLRDTLTDFWFGANIKVLGSSASSWRTGIALRHQDHNNYYLVQFTASSLSLVKVRDGSPLPMGIVDTLSFAADMWYYLSAYLYGGTITVYLNFEELFQVNDTSSPLLAGVAGLWLRSDDPLAEASANFDDVYVVP